MIRRALNYMMENGMIGFSKLLNPRKIGFVGGIFANMDV
jgi:hypothetical protein